MQRRLLSTDFISGVVLLGVAATFYVIAGNYALGRTSQMGPGYAPRAVSILLAAIAIVLMASALQGARALPSKIPGIQTAIVVGSCVLFGWLLQRFGLFAAATCLVVGTSLLTGRPRILEVVLLAVGLSLGSWFLFSYLLGLPLKLQP